MAKGRRIRGDIADGMLPGTRDGSELTYMITPLGYDAAQRDCYSPASEVTRSETGKDQPARNGYGRRERRRSA